MLDVHPPHAAAHTWRDFFIHIATIVVGLLIAVGLEQTVEAIHHHRERTRLLEGLRADNEQMLRDCEQLEQGSAGILAWMHQSEALLSDAARDHKPVAALPPNANAGWNLPYDPIYRAAKASAKLDLLHDDEVVAYAEVDEGVEELTKSQDKARDATIQLFKDLSVLQYGADNPEQALIHARPEQLQGLYARLIEADRDFSFNRMNGRYLRGEVTAVRQGEHDLRKIEAMGQQFQNQQ